MENGRPDVRLLRTSQTDTGFDVLPANINRQGLWGPLILALDIRPWAHAFRR